MIEQRQDTIRIICAALCRIEIGEKILLEVSKARGDILTPIGGALEFREAARSFVESIGKWGQQLLTGVLHRGRYRDGQEHPDRVRG